MIRLSLPLLLGSLTLLGSPRPDGAAAQGDDRGAGPGWGTGRERVEGFRDWVGTPRTRGGFPAVRLERITTAVPWPRGLVLVDGGLVVLARGRHRRAGGIDPSVPDRCGALFVVDPGVFEPVIRSEEAGEIVRGNARLLAEPTSPPFLLYDPSRGEPVGDTRMDRPYCTLAFDAESRNLFVCGYSGVDLPKGKFRKNATDSIHRYDLRTGEWHTVELHDGSIVPESDLGYAVANHHYPHHDPGTEPPPHGWLNGPDGGCVVGRFLYAVGKDNHTVARYDLTEVRRDPGAGPPPSERVFFGWARVRLGGEVREIEALGPSALASRDGWLYVGYRTSSVVLRFPIDAEGLLQAGAVGELIAVFEPWNPEARRSANLIDLKFNSKGELFVSCAQQGRVWNIGVPDPESPFDGVDVGENPTENVPYVDLVELTSNPRARVGNIAFDEDDRLYLCSGNYDSGTPLAGVVYRAVSAD